MVTKERLRQLVDALPTAEVAPATHILEALSRPAPGDARTPIMPEPGDQDRIAALPTPDEVRRRYGSPTAIVEGRPPVIGIDELVGDFWPEDEDPDEFDAAIRRWRDEDRVR